jgi:hypothetical protein
MKNKPKLYLLFNHTLTSEQEHDALDHFSIDDIVYFPKELLDIWKNIPPHKPSIISILLPINDYMVSTCRKGDYVLIQGDAGASYLAIKKAFSLGLHPCYATTKRTSVEQLIEGKVVKTSVFKHSIFRQYGE